MRFGILASALFLCAGQAGAVTIIGNAGPLLGTPKAYAFNGETGDIFKVGRNHITLSIDHGKLTDAIFLVSFALDYSEFEADNPTVDQGEDLFGLEECDFGAGCYATPQKDEAAYHLTNFRQSNRSISFDLNRPKDFNVCGNVFGVNCSNTWTLNAFFGGVAMSSKPIHYLVSVTSVPEPASWAMMIAGFGMAGAALRRRHYQSAGS